MRQKCSIAAAFAMVLAVLAAPPAGAAQPPAASLAAAVTSVIQPLMAANHIPGMAVGIMIDGEARSFYFGSASLAPHIPVNQNTLFEIGSISKTFNATLAAYAQIRGALTLTAPASAYLPAICGSAFDHITLLNLATYTAGGLPLQVPDSISTQAQLMAYYKSWRPSFAPGATRLYSNPSIGLFGLIAATRLHADYSTLLRAELFPALGLHHTFIVPLPSQIPGYAEGFSDDSAPGRMTAGPLAAETYGVITTAADLLRVLAINMQLIPIDSTWQRAILATHTGYLQMQPGRMVQDLAWEQYAMPVTLPALLAGNSANMLFNPNPASALSPPSPPSQNVFINKTGSTSNFGAYAAFIPADHIAVVLLANKSYPIPARVAAAYAILKKLRARGVD